MDNPHFKTESSASKLCCPTVQGFPELRNGFLLGLKILC